MNAQRKIVIFAVVAAVALTGVFLWQIKKKETTEVFLIKENDEKIFVVATFYPLEEFARAVGGDAVLVKGIVSAGVEPHDYKPTVKDIASIYQADIFFLNGASMDVWAEKILLELEKRDIKVLQMSEVIGLFHSNITDSHFWLDPIWAQREVEAIRETLTAYDPAHAEIYMQNADHYLMELADLDLAYSSGLRRCETRTVVVSHKAFLYLAKRYNFETISASSVSKETEISPRSLSKVIEKIRELNLRYVFFETLSNPKVAETLAEETGAQTLVFNPIEGLTEEERRMGKNYLSIMRENLNNLQIAMQCQK